MRDTLTHYPRLNIKTACLFLLAIFCVYWPALSAGFIWDDNAIVTDNPALKGIQGLVSIWTGESNLHQYYPLTFTSFWLQYKFFGDDPTGYHAVNVLVHILNAFLVWRIAAKLRIRGAFFAGLLFGVHPVHVESVAWISELKNVQSTFFYLFALLMFMKSYSFEQKLFCYHGWRRNDLLLFYVFSGMALLSKTVTCTLPVTVLIILWWKKGRLAFQDFLVVLPVFIAGLFLGLNTVWMEMYKTGALGEEWNFSLLERMIIASGAVWFYFGKLIWPAKLIFIYPRWEINPHRIAQYIPLFSLIVVTAAFFFLPHRKRKTPLTVLFVFIVTLFPALGFFNVYPMRYSFVADHFQYLASIAVIVGIAGWISSSESPAFQKFSRNALIVIVGILAFLSFQRTKVFEDKLALYNDIIQKNPRSWMAYNNRGVVYYDRGEYIKAISDFTRSLFIKPEHDNAVYNRANVYVKIDELDLALKDYNRTIEINPRYAKAYNNRGIVHKARGEYDLALKDFKKALLLKPDFAEALNNRGNVYKHQKKWGAAIQNYSQAIFVDPDYAKAYENRGIVYARMKEFDQAIKDVTRSIALNPEDEEAYYNRSLMYFAVKDFGRAYKDVQTAERLGYNVPEDYRRKLDALLK